MNITIAEALPLKNFIFTRIKEKNKERENNAFVEYEKGEEVALPTKDFETLTNELLEIRKDYRKLDKMLSEANVNVTFEWDGDVISIKEAIELANQIRLESTSLKSLSTTKKEVKMNYYTDSSTTYRRALFEPAKLAEESIRLEKKANRLSMLIQKANNVNEITFPEAEKYL